MVALVLFQLVVYFWSLITWPFYFLLYRPWTKTGGFHRTRARKLESSSPDEVIYETLPVGNPKLHKAIQEKKINTMDKLLKFAFDKYDQKNCLGTRRILAEKKVPGPNGKMFTKLVMEPKYKWLTYNEIDKKSTYIGRGFQILGLKARDKLIMYCDTKAEWMVTAMGCFKFNYSLVTIYTNLGEEGVIYGINQTQAHYVCTSQELLPKLIKVLDKLPNVHTIVVIEEPWKGEIELLDAKFEGKVSLFTWKSVYISGRENQQLQPSTPMPDDVAILMYTSGSTGNPKGVMLTHQNIVNACLSLLGFSEIALGKITNSDVYIGYLPLAHVLELLAEHVMLLSGIGVGYSSPNSLTDTSTMIMSGDKGDAAILKPTVMAAVPTVLDKVYKGLTAKIKSSGPLMSQIVNFCIQYRSTWIRRGYDTPLMNRFIFAPMKSILGGRVRLLFSGGAPLAEEAHSFIRTALGMQLHQAYGLTETASTATSTDFDDLSLGCVGKPMPNVHIKLVSWSEGGYSVTDACGARGEIHVGGGNVASGYYNLPEKTDEEFYEESGRRWFKTGDIGQVMPDGSFKIIDRKKDLVKLQMGEYVSLGKVESILKLNQLVDNICVCADSSQTFTVALVVPDESKLTSFASTLISKDGISYQDLCTDPKVVKDVLKDLTQLGLSQGLEKFEMPKQICLLSELWTPDSGMVTAAMKLKRKEIEKRYANQIAQLYSNQTQNVIIDMSKNKA